MFNYFPHSGKLSGQFWQRTVWCQCMYITMFFRVYILQDGALILDVQVHGNWTEKLSVLNLICLGAEIQTVT